MMKMKSVVKVPLVLPVVLMATSAFSQALPDIEGSIVQGGQIDDVIDRMQTTGQGAAVRDNEIDGEAGVYVLTLNEIFYVEGSLAASYAENPLRTIDDVGGSFYVEGIASAGVQTRIDNSFDFGVRASVSGVEYDKSFAPSSRNLNMSMNVGRAISGTPLYASVGAFGGYNFDDRFNNSVGFYGLSLNLTAGFAIGERMLFRPGVNLVRQWSEISENNTTATALSANLIHAYSEKITLQLSGRVSRTWFDDFYEDVTFVPRRDWRYGGAVAASYRLSDSVNLAASLGYEKQDSSFFLSNYDSFETSISVSAVARF